jgi:radical SAM superfamily enzyme YgiQ (UPF0313 family)
MKTVIIALNSKYIHTTLAPWYLKSACGNKHGEIQVLEHTVNESINDVLMSIYLNKPDLAAFSCYIWNMSQVLKLASSLKKLLPKTLILLGGPEASYDGEDLLKENEFVDFVLAGEGEESFPKLLGLISGTEDNVSTEKEDSETSCSPETIDGLVWRQGGVIRVNAAAVISSLDSIPSPYSDEMLSSIKNRIVYFESSRGCPFSCSYCLSSASSGTRFFSLERVFRELERLVEYGTGQIKFVDRTFNCHKDRALAIIKHIIELDRYNAKRTGGTEANCNFHFEVGADLFDEELLQALTTAPKGLFQIEAGVQTVNEAALLAINRTANLDRLFSNLRRLRKAGNINIHTDLIAGLPYEDYQSFGNSFDMVHNTDPNQLQLGFLKFLKGTRMRRDATAYGYRFNDFAPYEILSGPHLDYNRLILLKGIAELVERYFNSARFFYSIKYIIKNIFNSPFRFYESFYSYCSENGFINNQTGIRAMYVIFDGFADTCMADMERAAMRELLRLDFLASDPSGTLPDFLENRTGQFFKDRCFDFLKESDISAIIPEAVGMTPKQIFKQVHFEVFHLDICNTPSGEFDAVYGEESRNVYVFNYMSRDKVSGRYQFHKIEL